MDQQPPVDRLIAEADRLDELADAADLMGDAAGADRFHQEAVGRRERAMAELDRSAEDPPR